MNLQLEFQPSQIVYLESPSGDRLYTEVIQIVKSREFAWVRPLMLASAREEASRSPTLYDMRDSADLLWPLALFRPALDTEVIPLLVELEAQQTDNKVLLPPPAKQLRTFVDRVWQAQSNNS